MSHHLKKRSLLAFKPIAFGSPEYALEHELRDRMLRRPLGLDLFEEDMDAERGQLHFGMFDGDHLVACAVAVFEGGGVAKVRQMAVAAEYQKQGVGTTLMAEMTRDLKAKGIRKIILHARAAAVPFYEKLGFSAAGDPFTEVGIPHLRMEKRV